MEINLQQSGYTIYPGPEMSHPPSKVKTMKQHNQAHAETLEQACGSGEAASAAGMERPARGVEVGAGPVGNGTGGGLGRLSHPPSKVKTMEQSNPTNAESLERTCGWAEAANADILAVLRRRVGEGASRAQLGRVAETLRRMEAQMSAMKCDLAGRLQRTDGGAGAGEVLRDQLGVTNREAKHLSNVSRHLEEMPNTRGKMEAGEITLQNATALAAAAKECGARQVDQNAGLLAEAAAANPDDFRKTSRRFANQHSQDRGEKLLERQKRQRKVNVVWSKDLEMGILHAELDPISYGQVRQALDKRTDLLRREDSGGDIHPDEVRTNTQRRADALVELLTGRRAHTWKPLPDIDGKPGKDPTQLVVVADLGLIDGSRPNGNCEILGTGPVPPSVLENLTPDTNICGIIFGGKGRTLWLGRNRRLGNNAQRLAAAVRDKRCVQCDTPHHQTELHHLRDWHDGGPTDIDNLISLCGPHHRELQEHNRELVKTGKNWQTRPRPGPPPPPRPTTVRTRDGPGD